MQNWSEEIKTKSTHTRQEKERKKERKKKAQTQIHIEEGHGPGTTKARHCLATPPQKKKKKKPHTNTQPHLLPLSFCGHDAVMTYFPDTVWCATLPATSRGTMGPPGALPDRARTASVTSPVSDTRRKQEACIRCGWGRKEQRKEKRKGKSA